MKKTRPLSARARCARLTYLLVCLAEEASEVSKEALKAVRFGLDAEWKGTTALQRLNTELADLDSIVRLLCSFSEYRVGICLNAIGDHTSKIKRLEAAFVDSRRNGLIKPD